MYSPDKRTGVMSFLVYFFVLLVAASSVLFGLDWMQAPLQPPASNRTIQATSLPSQPVAPAPAASVAAAKPTTVAAAPASLTPVTAAVPMSPVDQNALKAQASDAVKADSTDVKPAPLCDVAACERAYHTFTVADCTYKPYEGPRRLCTKGNPPRRPSAMLAANEARAQATCNVSACESAYQSFDAATCTYQPFEGARRLCTK